MYNERLIYFSKYTSYIIKVPVAYYVRTSASSIIYNMPCTIKKYNKIKLKVKLNSKYVSSNNRKITPTIYLDQCCMNNYNVSREILTIEDAYRVIEETRKI